MVGYRRALLAGNVVGGQIILEADAAQNLVAVLLSVVRAELQRALFQLLAAVHGPDPGLAAVGVVDAPGGEHQPVVAFGVQAGLDVDVLAQLETLVVVEGDVEGILGGGLHLVAAAAAVEVVVVVLDRVVPVHVLHAAGPDRVVEPGADRDGHTGLQIVGVHLVDGALDPVGFGLQDGDKGVAVAVLAAVAVTVAVIVIAGAAAFLDLLDAAGDRGEDAVVFQQGLHPVDLLLLRGDLQLGFGQIDLQLLDLQRVAELFFVLGLFLFFFEVGLLLGLGGQRGLHLLQLQIELVQIERQGFHVVGEQGLTLFDLVARGNQQLLDLELAVLLDLDGLAGVYHAGEAVHAAHGADARNHSDGLDGDRLKRLFLAGAQPQTERHAQKRAKGSFCFHVFSSILPTAPGRLCTYNRR